jgi:hypothetical protein
MSAMGTEEQDVQPFLPNLDDIASVGVSVQDSARDHSDYDGVHRNISYQNREQASIQESAQDYSDQDSGESEDDDNVSLTTHTGEVESSAWSRVGQAFHMPRNFLISRKFEL